MPRSKLIDKCVVCQQVKTNERNRRISPKALDKAKKSNIYQTLCPQLTLDDIICNSCYCKVVEHDTYQKYKKTSRTSVSKYDRTFPAPKSKKSCVSVNINTYQKLVQKINSVEQLELELNELKIQLKNHQNTLGESMF